MTKERRQQKRESQIPPTGDRRAQDRMTMDPRGREPLPITERVGSDLRFTGRGVVAAFLDAGFYAHPDLTTPHSRIHGYYDLVGG
jgi:serine protease AprX